MHFWVTLWDPEGSSKMMMEALHLGLGVPAPSSENGLRVDSDACVIVAGFVRVVREPYYRTDYYGICSRHFQLLRHVVLWMGACLSWKGVRCRFSLLAACDGRSREIPDLTSGLVTPSKVPD